MPSSLIFAALAAAWLVVLVPMFARRRQEVSRTTDSALAARVVRRGSDRPPAAPGGTRHNQVEERAMPDTGRADAGEFDAVGADLDADEDYDDSQWRPVHSDDVRAGRRYRPGRGGFDPEAAALAARAKYVRRQRIVLTMLFAAVATGLAGAFVTSLAWWVHGAVDLTLAGYLTYLRRQVRIEEDVRSRRLARLSGAREDQIDDYDYDRDAPAEDDHLADESYADDEPEDDRRRDPRRAPQPAHAANAVVVEIDDEDPMFDELDERTWEPYRRAVGE